MAFERQWPAVAPQLFTADGGISGQIRVAKTNGFKVGAQAAIVAIGQPNIQVQIKRVMDENLLMVGPVGSPYAKAEWTDLSAYTVASSAYVYAETQNKKAVPHNDREEAMYEQEPVVARRVINVDETGKFYSASNPMPVQLSDGSINIETMNAQLDVHIDHRDNYPKQGDIHASLRIGDGTNEVKVFSNNALSVRPDNKLVDVPHDTIQITAQNASGDPTTILFKTGGIAGTVVRTLSIAYDSFGNIQSVARS